MLARPSLTVLCAALAAAACSARTVSPEVAPDDRPASTTEVPEQGRDVPVEARGVPAGQLDEAPAKGRASGDQGEATGVSPDMAGSLPTLAEISPMPAEYGLPDGRGLWTPDGPGAAEKMRRIRQIIDGPGGAEWAIANGMPEEELAKYRQWLGQPLDLFDPSRHREPTGTAGEAFARRNPSQRPVRRPWCFIHYHSIGIMIPYPCPPGSHPGGRE